MELWISTTNSINSNTTTRLILLHLRLIEHTTGMAQSMCIIQICKQDYSPDKANHCYTVTHRYIYFWWSYNLQSTNGQPMSAHIDNSIQQPNIALFPQSTTAFRTTHAIWTWTNPTKFDARHSWSFSDRAIRLYSKSQVCLLLFGLLWVTMPPYRTKLTLLWHYRFTQRRLFHVRLHHKQKFSKHSC